MTKRTDNFYVVVASATIDPKIFLKFFEKEKCKPLEVPGRVFPVTLLNWPEIIENEKDNDEDDRNEKIIKKATLSSKFVVEKVIEAIKKFDEGHTLVFLPGQKDCELCLVSWLQKILKRYLYLAL